MRLKNTSRYPDAEVRALVEFGMRGIRTARLQVNVKNGRGGWAGMAYEGVPYMSPASRKRTVDRLVTLRVGPPSAFPWSNVGTYPDGPWRGTLLYTHYGKTPREVVRSILTGGRGEGCCLGSAGWLSPEWEAAWRLEAGEA